MTDEEFRAHMDMLVGQARIASMLPLDQMAATVDRAESVGFLFVAPAAYQRALPQLALQRKLIAAAQSLAAVVREAEAEAAARPVTVPA